MRNLDSKNSTISHKGVACKYMPKKVPTSSKILTKHVKNSLIESNGEVFLFDEIGAFNEILILLDDFEIVSFSPKYPFKRIKAPK